MVVVAKTSEHAMVHITLLGVMGLLQLRFEHDSSTRCYEMRTRIVLESQL